jgi:outer membrane protein OmpA-like peptidoglycan-associated protein
MRDYRLLLFFLLVTPLLHSCITLPDLSSEEKGVLVGTASGAAAGKQLDDDEKMVVAGALVGAISGTMVGSYMDEQQVEMEQALATEKERVELEKLEDNTLKLILNNEVTFPFDSADIRPEAEPLLEKLSSLLIKYNQTAIHIIGHSDSQGSSEYNSHLSLKRAETVSQVFTDQGVSPTRIRLEGRGETEPRASNETEEGRIKNRRVAIYLKPIIEGKDEQAYESPRY